MQFSHRIFSRANSFAVGLFALTVLMSCGLSGRAESQGSPNILWARGGHFSLLTGASLSADGKWLVTSNGGIRAAIQAKVHRVSDGMLVKTFQTYNGQNAYRTLLSPTENKLATLGWDTDAPYAKLWSIPDGTLLWKYQLPNATGTENSDFHTIQFSPDGSRVYIWNTQSSMASNGTLFCFSTATGALIGQVSCTVAAAVSAAQVSVLAPGFPAPGEYDYNPLLNALSGWFTNMGAVVNAFSPDGSHLVSQNVATINGNMDDVVMLSNSQGNYKPIVDLGLRGQQATPNVNGLLWNDPNTIYYMALQSGLVQGEVVSLSAPPPGEIVWTPSTIWSDTDGAPFTFSVRAADLSLPGLLAVGGYRYGHHNAYNGFINVVNLVDGSPLQYADALGKSHAAFGFHESCVITTTWSANGQRIASGGSDGLVKVWQALDGGLLCTIKQDDPITYLAGVRNVALSPDGMQLAMATDVGIFNVYDIHNTNSPTLAYSLPGPVWQSAYSADGATLITAESYQGGFGVFVRNSSDGSIKRNVLIPGSVGFRGPTGLVLSADGKSIATFVWGAGNIAIYRASDLTLLHQIADTQFGKPQVIAFTPDGKSLAVGQSASNTGRLLALLNTADLSVRWYHGVPDTSGFSGSDGAVACDPCDASLVTGALFTPPGGATTSSAMFMKTATGAIFKRYDQETGTPDEGGISAITYSPDGQFFAYGRIDNALVVAKNPNWSPTVLASVAASPNPVPGGEACTGTVALDCLAPIGDAVVTLTSSNPTLASVPASVTLKVGQKTATFPVVTASPATSQTVTLSATYKGVTKTKVLTVGPPSLVGLAVSPSSVVGGAGAIGTVTMSGSVPADTTIILASANSKAHVPANVVVPAGSATATFAIATDPVSASTTGAISASSAGVTKSASFTVKPPTYSTFTLTPNPVQGGLNVTGTVTMTGPVAADTTVTITNANTKAHAPTSAIIPAGSDQVGFTITTDPTTITVSGAVKATVGSIGKSVTLKVTK